LGFDLASDDVLAYVIFFGKIEELTNLGRSLGTKTLGQNIIGETWKLFVSLLNDDEGEDSNIRADDATADGLAAPLSVAPLTIAWVAIGKKEADTVRNEYTLLHRKALFVIATRNAEDIALKLFANGVPGNFLG